MNRRTFMQLSTLPWLGLWACQDKGHHFIDLNFPIQVLDDSIRGHQLMDKASLKSGNLTRKDCLIVGGGIAGLTAACLLQDQDLWLCELSERIGGSSAFYPYKNLQLCQGAHYDLDYPHFFGEEATAFLEMLKILRWDSSVGHWKFQEEQFYIHEDELEQCYEKGFYREDVLADVPEKAVFLELMHRYENEVPLPSTQIEAKYRDLNRISFRTFLSQRGIQNQKLLQGIDYHMRDDYGADSQTVSALAGIVYYACRPYSGNTYQTFSPPEGNAYFGQKLSQALSSDQIRTSHLVQSIQQEGQVYRVEVLDLQKNELHTVLSPKIIYAAQKHTLKYVFPEVYPYFQQIRYAPWVVQNFVMKGLPARDIYWQNEVLSSDTDFLGFINSKSQDYPAGSPAVLTAYYCFPDHKREFLLQLPRTHPALTRRSLKHLSTYWGLQAQELADMTMVSYLKTYGHGMPIPVPDYLFRDANQALNLSNFGFAGTDNGRLPLFLEAVDSGIQAVKHVFAKNMPSSLKRFGFQDKSS